MKKNLMEQGFVPDSVAGMEEVTIDDFRKSF